MDNWQSQLSQGSSVIFDVRQDPGLILQRPSQVTLTSERRYARTGNTMAVKVLDPSLEGVRIQVGRLLDKTHIHQLVFEEISESQKWSFGPMECVPSKAKLVAFMRHVAQEIQSTKRGPSLKVKETLWHEPRSWPSCSSC